MEHTRYRYLIGVQVMNQALALDTARIGMQTGLMVSLPILATSLFLGLIVSVFQAVTQMVQFVHLCFQRASTIGL